MSEPHLRWVQLQGTVDACSHARQDDTGVALEAFGAAVNERDDRAGIQNPVFVDQDGDLDRTDMHRRLKAGSALPTPVV